MAIHTSVAAQSLFLGTGIPSIEQAAVNANHLKNTTAVVLPYQPTFPQYQQPQQEEEEKKKKEKKKKEKKKEKEEKTEKMKKPTFDGIKQLFEITFSGPDRVMMCSTTSGGKQTARSFKGLRVEDIPSELQLIPLTAQGQFPTEEQAEAGQTAILSALTRPPVAKRKANATDDKKEEEGEI